MKVKRYTPTQCCQHDGTYISYTDYQELEKKLEAECQRADALQSTVGRLAQESNRLFDDRQRINKNWTEAETVNALLRDELAALKAKLNQYQDIHYNGLNYNGLNLNPNEGTVIMNKSKQKCGKCGTALKIDPTVMLASLPPQPSYYCPSCDKVTAEKLQFVEQFNGKKNTNELVFDNKSEFRFDKVVPWNEELLIARGIIPPKPVIPMPKFEGFNPDIVIAMEAVFKASMEAIGFTVKGE